MGLCGRCTIECLSGERLSGDNHLTQANLLVLESLSTRTWESASRLGMRKLTSGQPQGQSMSGHLSEDSQQLGGLKLLRFGLRWFESQSSQLEHM